MICLTNVPCVEKAKAQQASNGLAKKTEALKIDAAPAAPSQPKVRSKGLHIPSLWEEGKSERKDSAAFVVIGHVDHGKSTLMGRLLLDTGAVAQRDIDKYVPKQSQASLQLLTSSGTRSRPQSLERLPLP